MDPCAGKLRRILFAAFLLCIVVPSAANANPINLIVTGEVTGVSSVLAGTFTVGQSMSATFTYESSTPALVSIIPTQASYPNALTGGTFSIGGYNGTTAGGNISVANNDPSLNDDLKFTNVFVTAASIGTHVPFLFLVQLTDSTEAALGDTSIPLTLPPPGSFNVRKWQLSFTPISLLGLDQTGVEGRLTSVTLAPVAAAEPSSAILLLVGTALFAACRVRRF